VEQLLRGVVVVVGVGDHQFEGNKMLKFWSSLSSSFYMIHVTDFFITDSMLKICIWFVKNSV
jgi:hypothetical protein